MERLRLSEARVGGRYRVVEVSGGGAVKRRLMDLGLVCGAEVKVVKVAPLGDPIDVEVKGFNIAIRMSEAQHVIVEVMDE